MSSLNQSKLDFFSQIEVSVAQLKQFIHNHLRTNVPLNILGVTGIGKTELIKGAAEEENAFLIDLNSTTSDVLDTGGLPFRNEKERLEFAIAQFLPIKEKDEHLYKKYDYVILFIDELPLAPRELQSVLYKLVQERMVRQSFLLDKVRIISAGNFKTDLGNHNEPPAPLKNREAHIVLRPDPEAFCQFGYAKKLHPAIIAFIEGNPAALHVMMEPESAKNYKSHVDNYAFNTNRSWHNLSTDLYEAEKNGCDMDYIRIMIMGHVGLKGELFYAFYKHTLSLPKIKDVLEGRAENEIEKWINKLESNPAQQSLKFYLAYVLCNELNLQAKRVAARLSNNNYHIDKEFTRLANNCFNFYEKFVQGDLALMTAYYFNYVMRFGLSHDLTDQENPYFKFVSSKSMKIANEYELKTTK